MSRMAQVIKACKARAAQEALVALGVQLVHSQPELLCWLAERNLAMKVGGADNLSQLQRLKGLVDPTNMFKNHLLPGLVPITSA